MSTTKAFAEHIVEILAPIGEVRVRPMMGEYILYYREKVIGGLYDGSLLIKSTDTAAALLPDVPKRAPYAGAKEMLVIENPEDIETLRPVFERSWEELPYPKKKTKKKSPAQ